MGQTNGSREGLGAGGSVGQKPPGYGQFKRLGVRIKDRGFVLTGSVCLGRHMHQEWGRSALWA